MSTPRLPDPVLLVVAAFSRHPAAVEWAQGPLEAAFGPLAWMSRPFDFHQTRYYEATMGAGLRKQFLAFADLVRPDFLADAKLRTNAIEEALATAGTYPEPRPLNLDPGLLTLGKFMLATTKNQAHRLYLRDGVYAEVTLRFHAGEFEPWPWTFADYREPHVRAALRDARDYYHRRLRG